MTEQSFHFYIKMEAGFSNISVCKYLFDRLKKLGIKHIFGVPGDYAFPLNDAVVTDPELQWIGNCNELNATYAADGYARINGYGAVCTTYGVGELCTFGGLAGAYAENVPIVHIVGMPPSTVLNSDKIVHHTLGNIDFHVYERMISPAVAATSFLTPKNAISEVNRVLTAMVQSKKPVYFCIAEDYCDTTIEETVDEIPQIQKLRSNESSLNDVIVQIKKLIHDSKHPVLLVGNLIDRFQLKTKLSEFIEKVNLPFVSMISGKASIDESLDQFVGFFNGRTSDPAVIQFIQESDCFVLIGTEWSDVNTCAFTAKIPFEKAIYIHLHDVLIGNAQYNHVEFEDVIEKITLFEPNEIGQKSIEFDKLKNPIENDNSDSNSPLNMKHFYNKVNQFLLPNDIVLFEAGTTIAMNCFRLPKNATCINQPVWAAIGYTTPAAFGAAIAAPDRRVVLVTGDGAFQMTAQEICQFTRYNLKPVLFVINNDGYLIERILCKDKDYKYNDIPNWRYAELMHAFGAPDDFLSVTAKTCGDLDSVLDKVTNEKVGAFIEVVVPKMDLPEYFTKFSNKI